MNIERALEAVLFYKGEPMEIALLSKMLGVSAAEVEEGITKLQSSLQGRGIGLIRQDSRVMLATAKETSELIEKLIKEELEKDLGKAALETLAIVLYNGPVARSHVDYIRGVNSQFIVRNLLIRGLIERIENPKDQRSFLYRPSFELLAHLGVGSAEEMPEYREIQQEFRRREEDAKQNASQNDSKES